MNTVESARAKLTELMPRFRQAFSEESTLFDMLPLFASILKSLKGVPLRGMEDEVEEILEFVIISVERADDSTLPQRLKEIDETFLAEIVVLLLQMALTLFISIPIRLVAAGLVEKIISDTSDSLIHECCSTSPGLSIVKSMEFWMRYGDYDMQKAILGIMRGFTKARPELLNFWFTGHRENFIDVLTKHITGELKTAEFLNYYNEMQGSFSRRIYSFEIVCLIRVGVDSLFWPLEEDPFVHFCLDPKKAQLAVSQVENGPNKLNFCWSYDDVDLCRIMELKAIDGTLYCVTIILNDGDRIVIPLRKDHVTLKALRKVFPNKYMGKYSHRVYFTVKELFTRSDIIYNTTMNYPKDVV